VLLVTKKLVKSWSKGGQKVVKSYPKGGQRRDCVAIAPQASPSGAKVKMQSAKWKGQGVTLTADG